jgi:hypothetical protein
MIDHNPTDISDIRKRCSIDSSIYVIRNIYKIWKESSFFKDNQVGRNTIHGFRQSGNSAGKDLINNLISLLYRFVSEKLF